MKKQLICLLLSVLIYGCSVDSDSRKSYDVGTNSSGTRCKFKNATEYYVKIYSDSLHNTLLGEVDCGKNIILPVEYKQTGNVFYYDYYLILNEFYIKYGDGQQTIQLKENALNLTDINNLNLNTNSYIVVGLKNETKSAIELYKNNSICFRDDGTSLINNNQTAFFLFYGKQDFSFFSISADGYTYPLTSKNLDVESGIIYTFCYKGKNDSCLISKVPFDSSLKEKIWKIPLSQTTGKCLMADRFCVQEKSSDGYFFAGQMCYDKTYYDEKSFPYIAEISPSGEVFDGLMSLNDSPDFVKSNQVIEANGMKIVAGAKKSDGKMVPFIYGSKNCDFYIEPSIENFDGFEGILYKENDTFSLLFRIAADNGDVVGLGIFELSVETYSIAEGNVVYKDTTGLWACDFIYSNGEYVVLSQEAVNEYHRDDKTKFLFINASSFTLTATKSLDRYQLNSIECTSDGKFAFASGSYSNSKTGKDEASFIKIDLENRDFCDNGVPKLFPSTENNLYSNFNCLSIKNNEIFLAGYIDKDYTNDFDEYSSGYPYLVSFDVESDKVNWAKTYRSKEYAEFEISSCYLSAIGTPLIELRNLNTGMSYLASCGLLGEIPDTELAALPRNTKITDLKIPDVCITVVDANNNEHKINFLNGASIVFSDIREKLTSNFYVPDGNVLIGFQIKNEYADSAEVVFPYLTNSNIRFYANYRAVAPSNLVISMRVEKSGTIGAYTKIDKKKIVLSWSPIAGATNYEVSYSTDNFKSYSIVSKSTSNCHIDVDLPNESTIYYFMVRVYNTYGWGEYSEVKGWKT